MKTGEQMRIKSYFAKTIDHAMTEARVELGDDAILLNTRKVSASPSASAGYELTFGVAGEVDKVQPVTVFAPLPTRTASGAPRASVKAAPLANQVIAAEKIQVKSQVNAEAKPTARASHQLASKLQGLQRELDEMRTILPVGMHKRAADRGKKVALKVEPQPGSLTSELSQLHAQLDQIHGLLARSASARVEIGRRVPEIGPVYARLLEADVDPVLAKDIANRLEKTLANPSPSDRQHLSDPRRLEALLLSELESRVALAPDLGQELTGESPVVVLVGPRGVGKTTSLAKLALFSARARGNRSARFVSLDLSPSRGTLLQSVAATYQIACEESSVNHLARTIASARSENAVFIDTPGYIASDSELLEAAAAALDECAGADIHLVVPAYMKARDLRECIQMYAPFRPTKLLVTKVDEAKTLGSVYSEAARAGLKLSFLTNGPKIPHEIRAIAADDLLEMALDQRKAREQYVA